MTTTADLDLTDHHGTAQPNPRSAEPAPGTPRAWPMPAVVEYRPSRLPRGTVGTVTVNRAPWMLSGWAEIVTMFRPAHRDRSGTPSAWTATYGSAAVTICQDRPGAFRVSASPADMEEMMECPTDLGTFFTADAASLAAVEWLAAETGDTNRRGPLPVRA